jgi:hypothetical protein
MQSEVRTPWKASTIERTAIHLAITLTFALRPLPQLVSTCAVRSAVDPDPGVRPRGTNCGMATWGWLSNPATTHDDGLQQTKV